MATSKQNITTWHHVERRPNMSESICIEDFCGRCHGLETSFSADYFPADALTYFTGDWGADVPPMPSEQEPTQAQAYAWARSHGGCW